MVAIVIQKVVILRVIEDDEMYLFTRLPAKIHCLSEVVKKNAVFNCIGKANPEGHILTTPGPEMDLVFIVPKNSVKVLSKKSI